MVNQTFRKPHVLQVKLMKMMTVVQMILRKKMKARVLHPPHLKTRTHQTKLTRFWTLIQSNIGLNPSVKTIA